MAFRLSKLVRNALLCEDIRQEKSNKHIILGIFADNIIAKEFPATLRFAIYVEIDLTILGEIETVYFRFLPHRLKPLDMEFDARSFNSSDARVATLQVRPFGLHIDSPRSISFDVSIDKKRWHRVFRKEIVQGDIII